MLICCEVCGDVIDDKLSEWFPSIDIDGSGVCTVGWAFVNDTARTAALLFNECEVDSDVGDTVGRPKISIDVADNAANNVWIYSKKKRISSMRTKMNYFRHVSSVWISLFNYATICTLVGIDGCDWFDYGMGDYGYRL